ncbi:hypothetical protein F4779DRAFT_448654 [Xylariaceae sp. FL0662B]|nr:hypothetical protein F4779DRAFT_448654 [Xylariaceae sp. FL0662B]
MALDVPAGTPDRGTGLVTMCVLLIILVTVATTTRIASKLIVKQNWWWDDFFALISLPIQITLLGLALAWRNIGLGLHADVVAAESPLLLVQGAKYLYIGIMFFDSSITFPKLSAIFFYARVFCPRNGHFTVNLWVVGSLVVAWLIAALVSDIFLCSPIEKAWNQTLPGTCANAFFRYLITAAISVLIDFYILLLPVPKIWALKMSLKRRIYLLAAFFLAYSVIVVSIGRLISTINFIPDRALDLTWDQLDYMYWGCLEGALSIISINVPNIVGLVKALLSRNRDKDSISMNHGASVGVHRSRSLNGNRDSFERLPSSPGSFVSDLDGRGYGRQQGCDSA